LHCYRATSSFEFQLHPSRIMWFQDGKPLLLPDKLYYITHYSLRISCIKVLRLGDGGSDYSAFVQHVGIPSMNIIFGEGNAAALCYLPAQ